MALKFVEHFMWIASAMGRLGGETGMWDEEDGFYYDVLRLPDGRSQHLKVRSMVGLLPLCAATYFDGAMLAKYPELGERLRLVLRIAAGTLLPQSTIPESQVLPTGGSRPSSMKPNSGECWPRCSTRTSSSAITASVRCRATTPSTRTSSCQRAGVSSFLPPGGVGHRHVRRQLELAWPDLDAGERPDNSRVAAILWILRSRVHRRMPDRLWPTDEPVPGCGGAWPPLGEHLSHGLQWTTARLRRRRKFQNDPHWRDCLLFYEYFHGDNGAGLGASHQTGWTGVIARSLHLFATLQPADIEASKEAYFEKGGREAAVASPSPTKASASRR